MLLNNISPEKKLYIEGPDHTNAFSLTDYTKTTGNADENGGFQTRF